MCSSLHNRWNGYISQRKVQSTKGCFFITKRFVAFAWSGTISVKSQYEKLSRNIFNGKDRTGRLTWFLIAWSCVSILRAHWTIFSPDILWFRGPKGRRNKVVWMKLLTPKHGLFSEISSDYGPYRKLRAPDVSMWHEGRSRVS